MIQVEKKNASYCSTSVQTFIIELALVSPGHVTCHYFFANSLAWMIDVLKLVYFSVQKYEISMELLASK